MQPQLGMRPCLSQDERIPEFSADLLPRDLSLQPAGPMWLKLWHKSPVDGTNVMKYKTVLQKLCTRF